MALVASYTISFAGGRQTVTRRPQGDLDIAGISQAVVVGAADVSEFARALLALFPEAFPDSMGALARVVELRNDLVGVGGTLDVAAARLITDALAGFDPEQPPPGGDETLSTTGRAVPAPVWGDEEGRAGWASILFVDSDPTGDRPIVKLATGSDIWKYQGSPQSILEFADVLVAAAQRALGES